MAVGVKDMDLIKSLSKGVKRVGKGLNKAKKDYQQWVDEKPERQQRKLQEMKNEERQLEAKIRLEKKRAQLRKEKEKHRPKPSDNPFEIKF